MREITTKLPSLEGARIYLRGMCSADVNERYLGWMNNPTVNRYLESRLTRHSLESLAAFVQRMVDDPDIAFFAIVDRESDAHIGNIKLGPIHWTHRHGDIGLVIGEADYWGQGIASEAIELITRFAFEQLGLNKVTAGCYTTNVGSFKAFLKAGFCEEGLLKSHYYCEGKFVDKVLLGRLRQQP